MIDETDDEPLSFEIGDGQLDQCLESCVLDAKVNVPQTFLLTSIDAFGDRHDDAIQTMGMDMFDNQMVLKINDAVEFKTPTGDSYVGSIKSINEDSVQVDFNHPLAGCDVSFVVELLEIIN
jgi:FKBP-type peptidyl-prolyl cis-trans isomerase 2